MPASAAARYLPFDHRQVSVCQLVASKIHYKRARKECYHRETKHHLLLR